MSSNDYGRRLAEQLVVEVKAAMVRAGIGSSRALGRAIGQSSQYVSSRLDGGNPRTGERVPLDATDLAAIAEALGITASTLVARAEKALDADDYTLAALDRNGAGVREHTPVSLPN